MKKREFKINGIWVILFIVGMIIFVPYLFAEDNVVDVNYSYFTKRVEAEDVIEIKEISPYVLFKVNNSQNLFKAKMINDDLSKDVKITKMLENQGVIVKQKSESSFDFLTIMYLILQFLPLLIIALLIFATMRRSKGSYAKFMFQGVDSKKVDSSIKKKFTFKDVAGLEESKQELAEVVEFLKNPLKFKRMGARIPKGVLMVGVPGTGKTLLAKAVAGEAKVPFFNVSGSEFVEMFVGVGASRVRDLFTKAKKNSPCIVFIDEIDAIAKQRGIGVGGGNDEKEQTLNQLLVEMDGFNENENVIIMAATNRVEVLDRAILRPGRFDRQVVVDIPTLKERREILELHAKNKPLEDNVDLQDFAKKTSGLVGADLENLLNEAAILAARINSRNITSKNVENALERVIMGPERKSKVLNDKERKIVAYHEAGHALVSFLLPDSEPVSKISIVPRGRGVLGYVLRLPQEDKFLWSKEDFLSKIKISMGGRAAEEIIFNEITSGAHNDIEKATKLAKDMLTVYGMSPTFGPQALVGDRSMLMPDGNIALNRTFSDETVKRLDKEMTEIIFSCYNDAKKMIKENISKLEKIAKHLLEHELIAEDELADIVGA